MTYMYLKIKIATGMDQELRHDIIICPWRHVTGTTAAQPVAIK